MTKYKLVSVEKLLYKCNVKSENAQFQFGWGAGTFFSFVVCDFESLTGFDFQVL
jgi:hypothetical protein